jgi:hypothetical protein
MNPAPQFEPSTIEAMVIELDAARRSDGLIDELHSLHERGVVRVIDIVVVDRSPSGSVSARGWTELTDEEASSVKSFVSRALGFEVGAQDFGPQLHWEGLSVVLGPQDVMFVADMLPPGRAALAVVFEHRWATRLSTLLHGRGVKLVEDDVFTPDLLSKTGNGISLW